MDLCGRRILMRMLLRWLTGITVAGREGVPRLAVLVESWCCGMRLDWLRLCGCGRGTGCVGMVKTGFSVRCLGMRAVGSHRKSFLRPKKLRFRNGETTGCTL